MIIKLKIKQNIIDTLKIKVNNKIEIKTKNKIEIKQKIKVIKNTYIVYDINNCEGGSITSNPRH